MNSLKNSLNLPTDDIMLDEIVEKTKERVEISKSIMPLDEIKNAVLSLNPTSLTY